jgi:RNA polymerase-binding transcription factor DksA
MAGASRVPAGGPNRSYYRAVDPDVTDWPEDRGGGEAVAAEAIDRQDHVSILDQVESELSDVEHALRRLDDGTYGECEVCGQAIGPERLAATPAARRCGEHAVASATPQLW